MIQSWLLFFLFVALAILVIGGILWLIDVCIYPLPPKFKLIVAIAVAVLAILYGVQHFGSLKL